MLKFLRGSRRTAIVWWLVILGTAVTFIIGFSVAPNLVSGREVRGSTVLGTVDGQPVTQLDLQNTYNLLAQQFVSQYGRDPAGREEGMLREQAWLQLVSERTLLQVGRKLGYRAGDAEVVFAVKNTPPPTVRSQPAFQTNGQFDAQKYTAALSDPQINWAPLEDEVRRTLPAQKLEERLLATAKFSEPELMRTFLDQYEKAQVTVARWLPSTAPLDTTKITEAMQRDYYDKHRGLFSGPVEAVAVVVVMPKKFTPEDDRSALDRARSLAEQARGGADFAQLARDHSEGPTADQGGEMGRDFRAADLPPDIAGQVGSVADSAVLNPVREGTKYYLMQVRRSPTQGPEPLYRLRQIVISIRISETSLADDVSRLEKLRKAAKARGLGPAAAAMGVAARETGWINSNTFSPELYSIPQAQGFVLTATPGTVSPIFDQEANWVLLQVKERREEGPRKFEDVRAQVKAYLEQHLRLEEPRRAAARAQAATQAGKSLEDAARAEGAATVEATGLFSRVQPPPQLVGSNLALGLAFALPVGQIGGPVTAAGGGVLLLRKDAYQPAPMASYDSLKVPVSRGLLSTRQNRSFSAWIEWLRSNGKVEDHRGDVLPVQ
jgi:peptidyl-prolyl cis-trans isomerase D